MKTQWTLNISAIKRLIRNLIPLVIALMFCGCATTKRDWQDANRVGTIQAYQQFLLFHPDADQADQARSRLKQLQSEASWKTTRSYNTVSAYSAFLQKYPDSEHAAQARQRLQREQQRDDKAFAAAKTDSSGDAMKAYIWNFPNGAHISQAKKFVASAEAEKKEKKIVDDAMAGNFEAAYTLVNTATFANTTNYWAVARLYGRFHVVKITKSRLIPWRAAGCPGLTTISAVHAQHNDDAVHVHGMTGKGDVVLMDTSIHFVSATDNGTESSKVVPPAKFTILSGDLCGGSYSVFSTLNSYRVAVPICHVSSSTGLYQAELGQFIIPVGSEITIPDSPKFRVAILDIPIRSGKAFVRKRGIEVQPGAELMILDRK